MSQLPKQYYFSISFHPHLKIHAADYAHRGSAKEVAECEDAVYGFMCVILFLLLMLFEGISRFSLFKARLMLHIHCLFKILRRGSNNYRLIENSYLNHFAGRILISNSSAAPAKDHKSMTSPALCFRLRVGGNHNKMGMRWEPDSDFIEVVSSNICLILVARTHMNGRGYPINPGEWITLPYAFNENICHEITVKENGGLNGSNIQLHLNTPLGDILLRWLNGIAVLITTAFTVSDGTSWWYLMAQRYLGPRPSSCSQQHFKYS